MKNAAIERIWELISRKISNEATEVELQELQLLLQKQPEEAYSLEIIQDLWNAPSKENKQYIEHQYKAFTQKMQKMGIDTSGFHAEDEHLITAQNNAHANSTVWYRSRKFLLACASLTAIIILTVVSFYNSNSKQIIPVVKASEITTKDGSKTSIVLPDGTKVWVNAGSKLTYDNNYGNKLREVSLSGEAFFDVIKNPEKPFVIHTPKMDIKVLGTAFNVRCYPNEKKTETSLIRGRIEVTLKDRSSEKIYLSPNEKLTLINDDIISSEPSAKKVKRIAETTEPLVTIGHITHKLTDSSIVETSWVENKLEFRSEAFEEVASKMERWYGVKIYIENEKLKREHLTGSFESETVEQALNALQYTTKFKFNINKNTITITK